METIFSCYSYFEERKIPAPKTVSRWLTQVGYYKLTREKEIADDWCYVIDNSIQLGKQKCLLILGVRLSKLKRPRPLTFEDIGPLELAVFEQVNAQVIKNALERAAEKTGCPRSIVSDEGPDVKPGVLLFIEQHTDTVYP